MEFLHQGRGDQYLLRMSEALVKGGELLILSIDHLGHDLNEAGIAANKSRKTETAVEQIYREGLKDLFEEQDLETRARRKHLYDCMCVIAERVERLGERLLHISLKLG
jgi:uncharacterized protein Yka (UPF0111/DUF47 family)